MYFNSHIDHAAPVSLTAHDKIFYNLPNTKENLGLELLINGVYEQDIVRFLQKQIQDGAVYFDVGANVGSLGFLVIKGKPNIHYYGFEASPNIYQYLQKNFNDNNIPHFELHK